MLSFPKESVQRQAFLTEALDEPTKGCKTTHDPLHSLQVSDWSHPSGGLDLLRVGLDASLGDNETQEHAPRHPEHALLWVEFYPFGP